MRKLVLFDIDGTLVLTGGAGIRAMNRAAEGLLGASGFLDGIPVAGRTDWIIFHDGLRKFGRDLSPDLFQQLRSEYARLLREEIVRPGDGRKGVMPGIRELLTSLASRDDVLLGLVTGNIQEGARIKLEHFGLWDYFRLGAFGDDAADRNALVPLACERARACGLSDVAYRDVLVIGDTPHDIACADAVGAVPVAVATGTYTLDELREAGATILFEDLSEIGRFLQIIDLAPDA